MSSSTVEQVKERLGIVEVVSQDAKIADGKIVAFRAKVKLSFKFE
ncbi:MAG: dodecin domain-containing protein [Candidatus Heimdallarchaeota archaeon]|nr:dodecin domain-containing protein [Candidatus Heimdallarchaeota archaeon]